MSCFVFRYLQTVSPRAVIFWRVFWESVVKISVISRFTVSEFTNLSFGGIWE